MSDDSMYGAFKRARGLFDGPPEFQSDINISDEEAILMNENPSAWAGNLVHEVSAWATMYMDIKTPQEILGSLNLQGISASAASCAERIIKETLKIYQGNEIGDAYMRELFKVLSEKITEALN